MTESNALPNTLSVYGQRTTVREMADRIRIMITGGKHLSDEEALALAQYSVANDLNPMIGECYYMPSVGPVPGIAGWRKKAEQQLQAEARRAAEPVARFWVDYTEPVAGEIKTNPGDIAVKVVLHDTLTKTSWERRILSYYIEMTKNSMPDAWDTANKLAGDEPTWSAVAVVRAGENFGGTEKMDRYERACKRAEKAAIRKRFPLVHLDEPEGFDDEAIDVKFEVAEPEKIERPPSPSQPEPEQKQQFTPEREAQLQNEMGFF